MKRKLKIENPQYVPDYSNAASISADNGEFLLAFARRNVPINRVFEAADYAGLYYSIINEEDEGEEGKISGDGDDLRRLEPIYRFTWTKPK